MSNFITLFLNKNAEKTCFDRIAIRKNKDYQMDNENAYTALYKADATKDTVKDIKSVTIPLMNHHDLLDYIEDVLDLMTHDIDINSYASVDILLEGYPVVCIRSSKKYLILDVVRSWAKRPVSL